VGSSRSEQTAAACLPQPRRVCLIRLSALGDVTHLLPIVHTLRQVWPETAVTWVIGRREYRLASLLPDIDFRVLDKNAGWRGYRNLRRDLLGDSFDLLLLMQVSMRAHLASLCVRAQRRLGYDTVRARDLHGLFVNERIPHRDREHVLDAQFGFLEHLGIHERHMDWTLPIPAADRCWAERQLPGAHPTLLISPASSVALRNWPAGHYAAVAAHAQRSHGMRVVLCGGPSAAERALADAIKAAMPGRTLIDLVGRDTLPRLLALFERATVLLGPDSGPAHMAAITDTPVIGLYGVSNPARCGPYKSIDWCVDGYTPACEQILGCPASALPWGTRIESHDAMRMVPVAAVCEQLDRLIAAQTPEPARHTRSA